MEETNKPKITEMKINLFKVPYGEWYYVHCISSDFKLGAGIAKTFSNEFGMRDKLKSIYPRYETYYGLHKTGNNFGDRLNDCLLVDSTFNLVTKQYYYDKPTYDTLRHSLESLKTHVLKMGIRKLAMPKIGCGLDGLSWEAVKKIIIDVFKDTEVSFLVCYL